MSSPLTSVGPAAPANRRFDRLSKRGKLRNGTFILPGTGERIRRQITLRNSANFDGPSVQSSDDNLGTPSSTLSQAGTFRTAVDISVETIRISAMDLWRYGQSPQGKGILKCSIAYLLGSMGTFLPPIANFLGHQDGKHMVATITVYFHPARSAGSMAEAVMLAFAAFCYTVFISVSSMAVAVFFETQLDMIELGFAIVLIVFCGGGLGFVGWFKQRYGAQLVNVTCSLASLAIITVLTKENAIQVGVFNNNKIIQVMKMVIMGVGATCFVNLLIWPVSARKELRETIIKATDSFGEMLTVITRAFLSGSETEIRSQSFSNALSRYKSASMQLTKNLGEAKLEHYILGTEEEYKLEASLVNCMQRLAQSIGGLRSAATTQFTLLKEIGGGGTTPANRAIPRFNGASMSSLDTMHDRFAVLTAIDEVSEEGSGGEDQHGTDCRPQLERTESEEFFSPDKFMPTAKSAGEIFSRFIMHLGPSMKSLAYTLSEVLKELPFGPAPNYTITINEHFADSLADALSLYREARARALQELYKHKELDKKRSETVEADFEEVAASCGHFSFNLYDFGQEMQTFLSILEELKDEVENRRTRSWDWMRFWQRPETRKHSADVEQEPLIGENRHDESCKDLPQLILERQNIKHWKGRTGEEDSKKSFYHRSLFLLTLVDRDDVRFALKVGIGAALYALFAFIPATRPFYQHWRGEWGLLSYMLVCSMTIGASNTTGWARFIGTVIGAILAFIIWASCQANPFALAFCGWVVSLVCFYIIVARGNGPFGRFIMLTYNLSCLYAYSLSVRESDDDEDEGGADPYIFEIALHRVVAVLAGVIWGLIVTRMIWPISARQKFKDGLSLLWLRMALIWKRDPLSTLLEGESQKSYMNIREELALQQYVIRLNTLRTAAASEFELRGPFPSKQYARIMESTSKILDAFHAINVVISKDINTSEGEAELLRYTADERAQLCARISHLFQVLASSMRLEYPFSDALPSSTHTRDRLLAKIFHYRKLVAERADGAEGPVAKDEDYEMLYAYTLVTGQLADEIKKVEKDVEELFGVMDEELLKLR